MGNPLIFHPRILIFISFVCMTCNNPTKNAPIQKGMLNNFSEIKSGNTWVYMLSYSDAVTGSHRKTIAYFTIDSIKFDSSRFWYHEIDSAQTSYPGDSLVDFSSSKTYDSALNTGPFMYNFGSGYVADVLFYFLGIDTSKSQKSLGYVNCDPVNIYQQFDRWYYPSIGILISFGMYARGIAVEYDSLLSFNGNPIHYNISP